VYERLKKESIRADQRRGVLHIEKQVRPAFWRRVLLPVIERYRDRDVPKYFRGDAAPKAACLLLRPADRS
jgi:hypothetical protein